ncbi:MAG: penicillin-binding protein 2 [Lachnospiraceae bacterium]|nr:penicillin-binding protein 2 [Lachnospiraceae bacterium]
MSKKKSEHSIMENLDDEEKTIERTNKNIVLITIFFVILFLALICYLFYFTAFRSESFINNSYNSKRTELIAKRIVRGSVLSRNGEVLARTVIKNNEEIREYPYGRLFAHAVGFSSQGSIGVESIAGFTMLTSNDPVMLRLRNDIKGIKNNGNDVVTTLDVGLQKCAYEAMGSNKGAVVVMNAKTGEILAMVSKPDFDPSDVVKLQESIDSGDKDTPFVNRATLGLYPPGSTFKIVTVLEYIREHPSYEDYEYECNGRFENEDVKISCYHEQKHGNLDLKSSFAESCNSSFANITSKLDTKKFNDTCKQLLFNSKLPCPFSYKESIVDIGRNTKKSEIIQAGIGQGKTMVTPMHMAMITSAIANEGVLVKPYIIDSVKSSKGYTVREYTEKEYKRLITKEESDILKEFMTEVINSGTGTKLKGTQGYDVAGKTGSAEFSEDKKKSHAWFTGFAPVDEPQIVVTVLAEESGTGGEVAAPIAGKIFEEWFKR